MCPPVLHRDERSRRSRRPSAIAVALLVACIAQPIAVRANTGGGPTGCMHLCPDDWTDYLSGTGDGRCVVVGTTQTGTQPIDVIPGSIIDCDQLAIEVTGRDLRVTDGKFWLHGKSLLVEGKTISAACSQSSERHGFRLDVDGDVTVENQGRLEASCAGGGGEIIIESGGDVTIGGTSVKANGTQSGGAGGTIIVRADGDLGTTVNLEASNTAGTDPAPGGEIDLSGAALTIDGELHAQGQSARGGSITLFADGPLTLDAQVNASGNAGDGGDVKIESTGTYAGSKAIRVPGISSGGIGGTVELVANELHHDGEVVASGGASGGDVTLQSRGGVLTVGGAGGNTARVDVTRSSNNPGDGGSVTIRSLGNDVTFAADADVDARGLGSGGAGGTIGIFGVNVTTVSGVRLRADGTLGGEGGEIIVTARGQITLDGETSADKDGSIYLVYRNAAPAGSAIPCPCAAGECEVCEQEADPSLPPPCGDGILRSGAEQCDPPDFGGQTCESQQQGSGALGCDSSCQLDFGSCTGS